MPDALGERPSWRPERPPLGMKASTWNPWMPYGDFSLLCSAESCETLAATDSWAKGAARGHEAGSNRRSPLRETRLFRDVRHVIEVPNLHEAALFPPQTDEIGRLRRTRSIDRDHRHSVRETRLRTQIFGLGDLRVPRVIAGRLTAAPLPARHEIQSRFFAQEGPEPVPVARVEQLRVPLKVLLFLGRDARLRCGVRGDVRARARARP